MSLEDEFKQFQQECSEVSCSKCSGPTGVWHLPWGPEGQQILCDTCASRSSFSPCLLCENTGRVYVPSFATVLAAADIREGRKQMHPFPDKIYWLSCVCICQNGEKFRIKSINDDDGSIIFVSHKDNPSTQTFLERGFSEEETFSFSKRTQEKQKETTTEKEIDW